MDVNRFRLHRLALCVLLVCAPQGFVIADELVCSNFELSDTLGKRHSLADVKTSYKVIVFLGTECPLAKLYTHRLNELATEFDGKVAFLGLNANCHDSNTEIAAYVRRHKLLFPVLKDLQNQIADQLSAERTPEAFLLDDKNVVRYRGRIDDQYGVGYARAKPTRRDLRDAILELLAGNEVKVQEAESVGCYIGRLPSASEDGDVTYAEHIAPIFSSFQLPHL